MLSCRPITANSPHASAHAASAIKLEDSCTREHVNVLYILACRTLRGEQVDPVNTPSMSGEDASHVLVSPEMRGWCGVLKYLLGTYYRGVSRLLLRLRLRLGAAACCCGAGAGAGQVAPDGAVKVVAIGPAAKSAQHHAHPATKASVAAAAWLAASLGPADPLLPDHAPPGPAEVDSQILLLLLLLLLPPPPPPPLRTHPPRTRFWPPLAEQKYCPWLHGPGDTPSNSEGDIPRKSAANLQFPVV